MTRLCNPGILNALLVGMQNVHLLSREFGNVSSNYLSVLGLFDPEASLLGTHPKEIHLQNYKTTDIQKNSIFAIVVFATVFVVAID